jgi:ADP-ribose pyrophosphatase YjhB (NUDIX family)
MYYSQEQIQQWKVEHVETLEALSELGWNWPEDPDLAELSHQLYRQLDAEHEVAIQMSARTFGQQGTRWTQELVQWEKAYDRDQIMRARQDLMTSCFEKQATVEFISDMKLRWERREFSSVTKEHIVIGDVYCRNEIGLPLQLEMTKSTSYSHYGTRDLFLDQWKVTTQGEIQWVRPQINGERFVVSGTSLVGFKNYEVDKTFPYKVLEYYAGKFYAIHPLASSPQSFIVKSEGRNVSIDICPHPKLSIAEYLSRKEDYANHKYDGLMLWYKTGEVRIKYLPSVEVEIEGETWQVAFIHDKPILLRPRPGKSVVSMSKARTWTKAQISYETVMHVLAQTLNPIVYSEEATKTRLVVYGSKCVFITREGKLLLIREPDKRLDLIGGRMEHGETPLDAIVREVKEETHFDIPPSDFFYFGQSNEESDHATWVAHLFLAWAPVGMESAKYVETYEFSQTFRYMEQSSLGRPWQVWLSRYFLFLHEYFSGLNEVFSALFLLYGPPPGGSRPLIVSVSERTMGKIRMAYVYRMKQYRQDKSLAEIEKEGYLILPEMRHQTLAEYQVLERGDPFEQKKWWKEVLNPPKTLHHFRNDLRLSGCPWSRRKMEDNVRIAVQKGFIRCEKNILISLS